jgi:aspartyl protease family protein
MPPRLRASAYVVGASAAPVAVTGIAATSPGADPSRLKNFARATDGLFHVTAMVNGQPVDFIVDTGASVVTLSHEDAVRAGVGPGASAARLTTASGHTGMRWGRIDRLTVAGRSARHLRTAIVDRGASDVSLLGANALAQLGRVTLRGDQLTIDQGL